jgi:hypothetical protein
MTPRRRAIVKTLATLAMTAVLSGGVFVGSAAAGGEHNPPPPGPKCVTKGGTVLLDQAPANVNNSDRKVTFCHATSSATNPFVVITTSINACRAHEEHTKLPKGGSRDVFPTGGCQD